MCNFLDAPELVFPSSSPSTSATPARVGTPQGASTSTARSDDDTRVIYRHYATLYFVYVHGQRRSADGRFVVDGAESELGILDLIQVFVESLDRAFENVCELDLIFHFDDVSPSLMTIGEREGTRKGERLTEQGPVRAR